MMVNPPMVNRSAPELFLVLFFLKKQFTRLRERGASLEMDGK
jgi:hypothetical protein